MSLTIPEFNRVASGPGASSQPQSGGAPAAGGAPRRTAGFANLVRATETAVAPSAPAPAAGEAAKTGARPDIASEVVTRIADEARAEAEAALALAIQAGQTLRTVIEAAATADLNAAGTSDPAGAAETGATSARLARHAAEQTDWRAPLR